MKYWSLVSSRLPAQAMALYPVMLFQDKSLKKNERIVRHEQIHFKQQIELLIIPFYFLYLLNYLINRLRYKNHEQAYLNICFEREAYQNDHNPLYLSGRRVYSWMKMV